MKNKLAELAIQKNTKVLGGNHMQTQGKNDRCFSVELSSKGQIKNMTMTEGQKEGALIEGSIGNLLEATFTEGIVLEVTGTKGTLRIDIQAKEIKTSI